MRTYQAMSVEGKSEFAILCYGVFPVSQSVDIRHVFGAELYQLFDDDWAFRLLLSEQTVTDESQLWTATTAALLAMQKATSGCMAAFCMFDGAFGSFEDVFGESVANQTYAFCFYPNEPVLCADEQVLQSQEWRALISACRERLLSN